MASSLVDSTYWALVVARHALDLAFPSIMPSIPVALVGVWHPKDSIFLPGIPYTVVLFSPSCNKVKEYIMLESLDAARYLLMVARHPLVVAR